MGILTLIDKPEAVYKIARCLSETDTLIRHCMEHPRRSPVRVSDHDVDRYMQIDFKVTCCFCNGQN